MQGAKLAMRRYAPSIFHPLAVAAVALLVVNDHYAKRTFHNMLTGKLSDVAGMIFFPWLLAAGTRWLLRKEHVSFTFLAAASAATAIGFALVKTWLPANHAYAWALGGLQWLPRLVAACAHGSALPRVYPAPTLRDASDLLALPFASCLLLVSYLSPAKTNAQNA